MITLAITILLAILAFFVYIALFAAVYLHVVDGLIISMAIAYTLHTYVHWHPAFCLLAFIASWIIVAMIQQRNLGYWLISGSFSIGYALMTAKLVYDSTHQDMIWASVFGSLSLIMFVALHKMHSPNYN